MPRGPRLDAPNLLHHVRFRGIERKEIFVDDEDREAFLERLERVCGGGAAEVLAWCLMPNHVHLAIRTGSRPLASTMRRLLTGYAMAFNKRHRRVGHLFQNRYKTTVVEEERYLLALVRYIHLNPVRAGLCADVGQLARWPWGGHAALVGGKARAFQAVDEVLGRFGAKERAARQELLSFMGDWRSAQVEAPSMRGGGLVRSAGGVAAAVRLKEEVARGLAEPLLHDERVLGSGGMVEAILAEDETRRGRAAIGAKERREALGRMMAKAIALAGISEAELCGGGRRRKLVRVRRAVAYLAVRRLGASAAETGRMLGRTVPSILTAVDEGARLMEELGWQEGVLLE